MPVGRHGRKHHDPIRIGVGQRLEYHGIHDRENGRIDRDPKSNSQDRGEREPRGLSKLAESEAQVLQNAVPPIGPQAPLNHSPIDVVQLSANGVEIAELLTCLYASDLRCRAARRQFRDALVEVEPQLRVDVILRPARENAAHRAPVAGYPAPER